MTVLPRMENQIDKWKMKLRLGVRRDCNVGATSFLILIGCDWKYVILAL